MTNDTIHIAKSTISKNSLRGMGRRYGARFETCAARVAETMRRWLMRVGRVLPNDIWVKGGPWHAKVFVQWDATATLLNGDSSYFNRGFHVITMRWGKVCSLDVFEDSQEVARGLAIQAESGLKEATAEQIVS